jgi:quaternary ammonium compound-resistance protein SugE
MPWLFLSLAGVLETVWPIATKYSDGLHRPLPVVVAVAALIANVYLLGTAMRTLSASTVYGVLIGFGAIGTSIASTILFGEPFSFRRLVSLVFVVLGVFGLKMSATSQ